MATCRRTTFSAGTGGSLRSIFRRRLMRESIPMPGSYSGATWKTCAVTFQNMEFARMRPGSRAHYGRTTGPAGYDDRQKQLESRAPAGGSRSDSGLRVMCDCYSNILIEPGFAGWTRFPAAMDPVPVIGMLADYLLERVRVLLRVLADGG